MFRTCYTAQAYNVELKLMITPLHGFNININHLSLCVGSSCRYGVSMKVFNISFAAAYEYNNAVE